MYYQNKMRKTSIEHNISQEGETIEQKIERIVNNKEPITDGAPIIYTERKEGVQPGYNIRTDRFDVAIEAMDKITKTHRAKREQRMNPKPDTVEGKNAGGEPTQGTSGNSGQTTE